MNISFDTETTGVDRFHGAKPFFFTTCNEAGEVEYIEWDVDPITRQPIVIIDDVEWITDLLSTSGCDSIIFHNAKFDVAMLATIRKEFGNWDWDRTHDTLLMAHLLYSNRPKNLTDLGIQIVGKDIEPLEIELKKACDEARRIARSKYKDWMIAKADLPCMPSAGEKVWKYDTWLPRRIAQEESYSADHPWWTVLSDYANADSMMTVALFKACIQLIRERGLEKLYNTRRQMLPTIYEMEQNGITMSRDRYEELLTEYTEEKEKASNVCVNIAADIGYELNLPKSGNNKSLLNFCFGESTGTCEVCGESQKIPDKEKAKKLKEQGRTCNFCKQAGKTSPIRFDIIEGLNLPIVGLTDSGNPSLDKNVLENYLLTLPQRSKQRTFVDKLAALRKRSTAISYMESYTRFWLPAFEDVGEDLFQHWMRLHPSLNPTGTDTLRCSSSNPNEQNISKKEGFNLRYLCGPLPGREWWSCDARGIEDRLPAYESQQDELITIFEKPDEPPYYGSNHLLRFHTVYPDIWEQTYSVLKVQFGDSEAYKKVGPTCKKQYASTYYQWVKNGGFAVQYGAIDRADGKGTADLAFHRPGCHALLKERFSKLEALNQKQIRHAEKFGYVETIPDRDVDPKRGYPLLCTRTEWGKILPTVPLNYHIQGTAMWWMMMAMIRVHRLMKEWRQKGFDARLVMQIHDELVFDFPKSKEDPQANPKKSNLWRIRAIQKEMEKGGLGLGIPTPTSCEYHPDNWSTGISF
jgi:DNA polymerase I-like protein with 3'-5' exonuclease and polymerase domains